MYRCRVLVVIDGFNSFFYPETRAKREDRSVILPSEFLLTDAFLSITRNDWVYCLKTMHITFLSYESTLTLGEPFFIVA